MNTAKWPPSGIVTNALRGAWMDSTKVLARLVGVVKSSAPWKTKTGTAKSPPSAFAVSALVALVCGTRRSALNTWPSNQSLISCGL